MGSGNHSQRSGRVFVVRSIYALVFVGLAGCDSASDRISDAVAASCTSCAITFVPVATLGSAEDTISPNVISTAIQAGNGTFYVAPTDHPGVITVYTAAGKLVRMFGRTGDGPGEYDQLLKMAVTPGDTISVIDVLKSRRTIIDSLGQPLRTHSVPFQFEHLAAIGNRLFVQADLRGPGRTGKPIHEIAPDGTILSSFADVGVYRSQFADAYRPLAAALDGGLWVAMPTRYEIHHYSASLQRDTSVTFDVDWFPPNSANVDTQTYPPEPRIIDIWQTSDSILWLLVRVADLNWKPWKGKGEGPRYTANRVKTVYDYIVEAIDPSTMTRVASVRFDEGIRKGIGDDLIYALSELEDGRVQLTAYRLALKPRSRGSVR